MIAEIWRRFEIHLDKRTLDAAIASGDPSKWRPIMGQSRHFNVPREKGIALLLNYLDHPDVQVRLAAAEYLFELGAREGGPVLVRILKSGAVEAKVSSEVLTISTRVLHQYRYPVDADLIFEVYQKNPDVVLLQYAQLLGSDRAKTETQKRLLTNGTFEGSLSMAGIMRLSDSESLAMYRRILEESRRAADREEANVALYRATQESAYLEFLIAAAEEKVGMRPRTEKTDSDTGRNSIIVLQQTVTPETTKALRRIEAYARKTA